MSRISWITLYPHWYTQELQLLSRHYPDFRVDENQLKQGVLVAYGELVVRPPRGTKKYPVKIFYPQATPYVCPFVIPLKRLPRWAGSGGVNEDPEPEWFDHRHQMPQGNLCLFQRETRAADIISIIDVLKRAKRWFLGLHTGRWPPDSEQSEIESHFMPVTDVLVPEIFFDPQLNGRGRLFFGVDHRRYWLDKLRHPQLGNYDVSPLILALGTEESKVIRMVDGKREVGKMYPWLLHADWDPMKLASTPELAKSENAFLRYGYWWSISSEPEPFHNGLGLLKILNRVPGNREGWVLIRKALRGDIETEDTHIIGLKYPARGGGVEWLIVCIFRSSKRRGSRVCLSGETAARKAFEQSSVGVIRVHRIGRSILHLRNKGVVSPEIGEKVVALIGLGALGSQVAELLAKAGVGRLRLCDSDRLSTGNVARHVGGITDFGARKTRVVMSRMLEINPRLEFTEKDVMDKSAVGDLEKLADFIAAAHLTVCTVADEDVESVINQIAVLHTKQVLYGRSMRGGSMARVFLVRPGKDACKRCLGEYRAAGRKGKQTPDDWIDVQETDQDVLLQECGRPVIAGSGIDLSFVASLIARCALDVLEGRTSESNHWLWSRSPTDQLNPRLASPLSTFIGRLAPRPECPVCQEPSILELIMTDKVRADIISMTKSSPEKETGGILIGFVDSKKRAVVVEATGPGPNAVRSATLLRRDVEYVQERLDLASTEIGYRGRYLGEWHSHLDPVPKPSFLDIDSLFGISQACNYLTGCPVMVICGFDRSAQKVTTLCSWIFPISGRMRWIQNETVSCDIARTISEDSSTAK